MPLYELRDDRGNRCRIEIEEGAPSPIEDMTIAGRVFGALEDGSGGFVTDPETFDAMTRILAAINAEKTAPPPAPAPSQAQGAPAA